jgi:hypothetical protein
MDLKKHEELLKELQAKHPTVVLDGAVNNDQWNSQKDKRILWILKEVNDFAGDLRNLLNDPDELYKYSKWKLTYGLVAKVSYGLLNNKWVEDADSLVKGENILQKVAVINVNKLGGKEKSSIPKLRKAAKDFYDKYILKQIESLDPDIVILGGTAEVLPEKDIMKNKWIPAYHPGQRKITHKQYYDLIVKKLKA